MNKGKCKTCENNQLIKENKEQTVYACDRCGISLCEYHYASKQCVSCDLDKAEEEQRGDSY
jgi:ribosomal protein L37E